MTPTVDIQPALDAVSIAYNVPREAILGKSRQWHIVRARHALWWSLRCEGHSYPVIASLVGRGDHTTIMAGVARHESRLRPAPPGMPSDAVLVACEERGAA